MKNTISWKRWIKKKIKLFDRKCLESFIFRKLHPRKVNCYGIGTPKSGTHSIKNIFSNFCRSLHEPGRKKLIAVLTKYYNNQITREKLKEYVKYYDYRWWLEMNSSCYNYFILDEVLELNPNAKFILTIRNPYAWLDSWFNHQLNGMPNEVVPFYNSVYQVNELGYPPEEKVLKQKKLPPLEGMLSYWNRHNTDVLKKVSEDKLLVVATNQITEGVNEILEFAGKKNTIIRESKTHSYQTKKKHHILNKIDQVYLKNIVDKYCSRLLHKYFPDIQSPVDGLPTLVETKES